MLKYTILPKLNNNFVFYLSKIFKMHSNLALKLRVKGLKNVTSFRMNLNTKDFLFLTLVKIDRYQNKDKSQIVNFCTINYIMVLSLFLTADQEKGGRRE